MLGPLAARAGGVAHQMPPFDVPMFFAAKLLKPVDDSPNSVKFLRRRKFWNRPKIGHGWPKSPTPLFSIIKKRSEDGQVQRADLCSSIIFDSYSKFRYERQKV